jgi:hypothetical protein
MAGRPRKYTKKQLEEKLTEFWKECIEKECEPTKEQLVVFLDIHKDTYNEWKKPEHEFSDSLKKAESKIEAHIVNKLLTSPNATGVIFYLKNAFQWRDSREVEGNMNLNLNFDESFKSKNNG